MMIFFRLTDFSGDRSGAASGLGLGVHGCLDVDVKNEPISPPPEAGMPPGRCHGQQHQSAAIPSSQQQHQQQQHLSVPNGHRSQTGQSLRSVILERQFLSVPSSVVGQRYHACQSQPLENHFLSPGNHDALIDSCSSNSDLCFQPMMGNMLSTGDHRFNPTRLGLRAGPRADQCYPSIQSGLTSTRNHQFEAVQNNSLSPGNNQYAPTHGSLSPGDHQHQFHGGLTAGVPATRDHAFQLSQPHISSETNNLLDSSSLNMYQCHRNFDNLYSSKRPRLAADDWLS